MSSSSGNTETAKILAAGLTSIAVIAFQLVMMQQFAVTQWHHFAQFVIAVALLGFGAAGTVLALFREKLSRRYEMLLPVLFGLCGLTMAGADRLASLAGDFDALLLFMEQAQLPVLLMLCLAYLLPFFFGGLAITLLFYKEVDGIGKLYASNMAGSGLGAAGAIGLMYLLPVEQLPGILALLPLASGWLCSRSAKTVQSGWVLATVLVIVSVFTAPAPVPSEYKSMSRALLLPDAERILQKSGPHGRLEVVSAPSQRYAPSLSLNYTDTPPIRDVMFLNGEYFGTLPVRAKGEERFILDYTTRALPWEMRSPENVLVLNAATGNDAAHALTRTTGTITAVEPNTQAVGLFIHTRPELNDSLYLHPDLRLQATTSRSHLAQTRSTYDLIVLPVLDSFGGSAGVYALNEEYHLTQQAFSKMWERLSDDGMIALTTWVDYPLRYALRIPMAFRKLLEEKQTDHPENHIAAVRSWGTITYVMSKSPITEAEVGAIRNFSAHKGFDPLWFPDIHPEEREQFHGMEEPGLLDFTEDIITGDYDRLLRDYLFYLSPATDNRPFFSHFMKAGSIPVIREMGGDGSLPYMEAGFILAIATFILVFLVSALLIILPLFSRGWTGRGRLRTFLYFTGTGTGFIMFEMVLIQQMTLYLGLPVFAAALVLATLLIGSGAGSLYSSRLEPRPQTISTVSGSIILSVLACVILIPVLVTHTMGWPLLIRFGVMGSVLLVPAFMMGMMFPLGLRNLRGGRESHIPWACGVDSFFSVTAASLAILISLQAGFIAVMLLSALAYSLTIPAVITRKQ